MARYEQTTLGDEHELRVTWTTRDSAWPFMLTAEGTDVRLTNKEARDLALFLTKYLLEYVE